jgi:ATP-binding cassette subfamily B protein
MHGSSWGAFMRHDEKQSAPDIDRALVRRVLSYARPYKAQVAIVLVTIVVISLLSLLPPLLMRALLDTAIPQGDLRMGTFLGIGMVAVPLINGVVGVVQRRSTAKMGEGIIYDLRRELFDHLPHRSLGCVTNT